MKFLFLRCIKSLQKSSSPELYKMSQKVPFCLHIHFSKARQNRLKRPRWQFCTPKQKEALKTKEF